MKLNKPLLRRLARKLRRLRHEEHYDQTTWAKKTSCGTVACIAGHAVIEEGYRFLDLKRAPTSFLECRKGDGPTGYVQDVAADLLGLDIDTDLFSETPKWDWPEAFAARMRKAKRNGPPAQRPSRIAADLLDAIADTDGEILEREEPEW